MTVQELNVDYGFEIQTCTREGVAMYLYHTNYKIF